ncbi:MAG: O-antigen ligase family protein, partial [Simkaniaceae bacterium]|nr:O-antigen ligase family protein [Simkaniaceae bacterium]
RGGVLGKNSVSTMSDQGRIDAQTIGTAMFKDHPLLGIGPQNYCFTYNEYAKEFLGQPVKFLHNSFLFILVETGLIGFLLLAAFLLKGFIRAIKSNTLSTIALSCMLLQLLMVSFIDHYVFTVYEGRFLFFLTLGLLDTQSKIEHKNHNKPFKRPKDRPYPISGNQTI